MRLLRAMSPARKRWRCISPDTNAPPRTSASVPDRCVREDNLNVALTDTRERAPAVNPYCAARVAVTGSPRAGARLLSMLKAPAPLPKTISSPPAMARFLRKLAISICCCAAGTAQKLWNTSVTGTRKMSSASAPQRALNPSTTDTAPNNSRAVAIASRISGTPLLAAYATVPRQPASFPSPLTRKIIPSATRPTTCAHFEMASMCSSVLVTHSTAVRRTRAASAARGECACGRPAGEFARSEPHPPPGAPPDRRARRQFEHRHPSWEDSSSDEDLHRTIARHLDPEMLQDTDLVAA